MVELGSVSWKFLFEGSVGITISVLLLHQKNQWVT